jgi:hypothetical protein
MSSYRLIFPGRGIEHVYGSWALTYLGRARSYWGLSHSLFRRHHLRAWRARAGGCRCATWDPASLGTYVILQSSWQKQMHLSQAFPDVLQPLKQLAPTKRLGFTSYACSAVTHCSFVKTRTRLEEGWAAEARGGRSLHEQGQRREELPWTRSEDGGAAEARGCRGQRMEELPCEME